MHSTGNTRNSLLRSGLSQLLTLPTPGRVPCLCCHIDKEPSTEGVFSLALSDVLLSNDNPEFYSLTPIQKSEQDPVKFLPTSYHGGTSGSGC